MKGKWAKGIAPRFFAWIIKDKLAVSERPGGYARNHRRVRRQEEILWLRGEGFTRVVSLLTSPHNLHAYDELDMAWAHIPFSLHDDPHLVLPELYGQLRDWMASGERLLIHHEELSDRLMGIVAGYLRWSGLVPAGPQAISVVERIMHRQMGPDGRELVALAPQLAGAGGCGPVPAHANTTSSTSVSSAATVEAPSRPRQSMASKAASSASATSRRSDAASRVATRSVAGSTPPAPAPAPSAADDAAAGAADPSAEAPDANPSAAGDDAPSAVADADPPSADDAPSAIADPDPPSAADPPSADDAPSAIADADPPSADAAPSAANPAPAADEAGLDPLGAEPIGAAAGAGPASRGADGAIKGRGEREPS